jgi:hypothetical protein
MTDIYDELPRIRLRMQKYVYKTQSTTRKNLRHKSVPQENEWTHKKIFELAHVYHSDALLLLEGRYEQMKINKAKIAVLKRLLDQIESGMIELVNGEPVFKEQPTKKPDALHRVSFLMTGRPVLKVALTAPEPAKTLINPFKKRG